MTDQQRALPPSEWRQYEIHITGYHETWASHGRDKDHAIARFQEWWQNPADEIVACDTGKVVKAV